MVKVAKIVGVADENIWSQVHEFLPDGEKLNEFGQLAAVLKFESKKEIEISSFGTEIITRLQEIYYSNESKGVLKKMSQAMESLSAEFLTEVELKIVMAVILKREGKTYLYVGRNIDGLAFLKRKDGLVPLLKEGEEGEQMVSGEVKNEDRLILGTNKFFEMVDGEVVKSALEQEEVNQMMERMATVVHGHEKNSQAAAAILKFEGLRVEEEAVKIDLPDEEKSDLSSSDTSEFVGKDRGDKASFKVLAALPKKIVDQLKDLFSKFPRGREVFVRRGYGKKQKSAATVALALVVIFSLSLFLAGRKRQRVKEESQYTQVLEEVGYKYDEAKELIELNPLRAKSLLRDSKDRIESYRLEQEEELSKELKELLDQIEVALGKVQRDYQLESATEWFDFGLTKEGFKGSDWESEENKVFVWDEESRAVVEIDLETKASGVVIGGDKIDEGELVGLAGERGFVVSEDLVVIVEGEDGEVVAEVSGDEWSKLVDAVGFSSNLYLLDGSTDGQIWKYMGVNDGLSSKKSYLQGDVYDLSEAVSMAIDGSVWVLFSDGTIAKYVRGIKDSFAVSGLEEEFKNPVKLFTSPEVENLYVFDQQGTKVVVIDKTGEYKAQYVWPGMAGVKDLVVSEDLGKMFLLTGEKVFTIDLR